MGSRAPSNRASFAQRAAGIVVTPFSHDNSLRSPGHAALARSTLFLISRVIALGLISTYPAIGSNSRLGARFVFRSAGIIFLILLRYIDLVEYAGGRLWLAAQSCETASCRGLGFGISNHSASSAAASAIRVEALGLMVPFSMAETWL
jgi:hypothetical protein